jgi:hypothetical protein
MILDELACAILPPVKNYSTFAHHEYQKQSKSCAT